MLTIRQLTYLVALAETRHFGRAAERCAVTQPALSTQIRALEGELGVVLVERRPSGVVLTGEGFEVVRRARTILGELRDLVDYARHDAEVLSGTLRLGAIPSIAPYLLPKALPRIAATFPHLDLSIRETVTANLLGELADGHLDAAVLALPADAADTESTELFEDPFVIVLPAGEADAPDLAGDRPVAPAALAGRRLLLLEEGHCLRDQALSICSMVAPADLRGFGASSLTTLVQMVANGFGATLLPQMALETELRGDPGVAVRRFAPPVPARKVGLVWRASSPRRRDFLALAEVLKACHCGEG